MSHELRNNLPHRIYRNGERVAPGGTFKSSEKFDRDNFPPADEHEADDGRREDQATAAQDRLEAGADVARLGRAIGTSQLRDRVDPDSEHAERGTGVKRANAQPSAHGPEVRSDVDEPGTPDGAALLEGHGPDGESVEFTSESAEEKARESGVIDSLAPGEGSGKGGAYTVADVESAQG